MRKFSLLCLLFAGPALAQTFDLEQFDQIFRPRLRLDARWTPGVPLVDAPGKYEDRSAVGVFTFPAYKRWSANVQLDLSGQSWKDLLKNSVRVKASQVMGNVRLGTHQVIIGDADTPRLFHTGSLGVLGISLTRKYRVLFWSASVNVSEEDATLDEMVPRISGVIGKLHINGLRKQFYYGLVAVYSDGFALPLPFIGGQAPIGDEWSFQYTLPAQVAFGWRPQRDLRFQFGAGLGGWRTGADAGDTDERTNLNYRAVRVFANMRKRLNDRWQLRSEVGYARHDLRLTVPEGEFAKVDLNPGLTASVGVNLLFGESTLERIMDEVLK